MSHSSPKIRRHFLSWDRPWVGQAAAWLARDWDKSGALDLSAVLAIVPTQQAGRRLREALAELAAKHGAAVFAPRVLTPEALVRQDPEAEEASPLLSLLAWNRVFLTLNLDDFREVLPVDPPQRNFAWALRLGQAFVRLQVALGEAGLGLSEVALKAGEDFIERSRWEKIAVLDGLHAAQLAAWGRREPQSARISAASRARYEEAFRFLVVLAVPDVPPLARARIARAAEANPVDVLVWAPVEETAGFDEWGRPRAAVWEHRELVPQGFEERMHLCPDPASQAARVAELAAAYSSADGILGVGIADPDVAPLLENELRRRNIPVFNPEGRRLRHEALHALLTALADLARDPSFATVETLARCPDFIAYLKRQHGKGFSAARWLEALDDLRATHLPVSLDAGREFAAQMKAGEELARGLETIAAVHEQLASGAFTTGATEVLGAIFAGRQVDRAKERDQRFEEAAGKWTEVVRACAEAESYVGPLRIPDGWELALRLYGEQRGTAEKPEGALELQGWLELPWEDAPHLVVAGMNDGRVPEAVPEDAFLPGALRERLGLTTNAMRFARDAYWLHAIMASRAGRGRVDFLIGRTAAGGDPLRPSRLLLQCADAELPGRIRLLFHPAEAAGSNAPWTRAWKLAPRVVAPPARVAVTALKRYLSCPFRFYLNSVLRMDSVDPLKSELDAFDFGTLCHAALEQLGSDPGLRTCANAEVLRSGLISRLDQLVATRYGRIVSLPLLVQVESARQRLGRLAELQAAERAAGWEIIGVERAFEVEVEGLSVRGKVDRIDRHVTTGAVRVLDYKTSDRAVTPVEAHLRGIRSGERAPEWARLESEGPPRVWADLQLPLYFHALAAEFPAGLTLGYLNLPKASGETALALWEDYTRELHAAAMRCAAGACAAIRRGEFWPPNEMIRAERDECAVLFHHGVEASVTWAGR